jgi:two-component system chemotaxis response regulator CheB
LRALVVDDSRPVRSIIAKMMRSLDFETREVTNGKEAMELLESDDAYDVVTVNWQMPVMDGMELVAAIRKSRRFQNLPLLMISSESDAEQVAMAINAGVNQYIVKPCTEKSIAGKLTLMGVIKDGNLKTDATAHSGSPAQSNLGPGPQSGQLNLGATSEVSRRSPSAEPKVDESTGAEPKSVKIRVMLVDDSSVVRRVLTRTLAEVADIEVVGSAGDGVEGLEMIERLSPDVVLLDVDMPRMDGLETLRELRLRKSPIPVVMFSSRTERGAKTTTEALLLGAKDFVFKPGGAKMQDLTAGAKTILDEVVPRIRSLAPRSISATGRKLTADAKPLTTRVDLVVIAASTGGPVAIAEMMSSETFRSSLYAPIVIAQHMPEGFTKHLAGRLSQDTGLDIAEAVEGERLIPGLIRIAPGGRHTVIRRGAKGLQTLLNDDPPVNSCRPAADVLFLSAAESSGDHVLAVVLTGMGRDGTDGCRRLREAGCRVIVQDEASSVVWGMPGSVAKAGLADRIVKIEDMGAEIARHVRVMRTGG